MEPPENIAEVVLPPSAIDGVAWPPLPQPGINAVLSLAYQLEHSQWWSAEILTAFQLRQAENLLRHAQNSVPFYRERLKHLTNVRPGELRMEDFNGIPLLQRAEVQEFEDDLKSSNLPNSHLPITRTSTSGSTGQPISVLGTGVTSLFNRALATRWNTCLNRDFNGKFADIRMQLPPGTSARLRWVPGFTTGPMVTIGANTPIEAQIEWLLDENPHYLQTFPSNLRALLQHCEHTGVRISNLREASTRGEALDPELRDYCRQIWGVPMFDSYGANEVGYIALQCPDTNHYHVQSEHVLVEVLDDKGNPVETGNTGKMVITDLHNFASPMIRYEIGDYAVAGSNCRCGRGLPVLERVLGRARNLFVLPSGDRFYPIYSQALARLQAVIPNLLQTQLVQQSRHEITARLVVSEPLQQSQESKIAKELGEALGGYFGVRVEYFDEIPRTASGKFFETLCEIDET